MTLARECGWIGKGDECVAGINGGQGSTRVTKC